MIGLLLLPVDRLASIQIGGMEKTGIDFDYLTEGLCLNHLSQPLHGWEERGFRAAAHEDSGMFLDTLHDRIVRLLVNAERFLSEQMFSRTYDAAVQLFV